MTDVRAPLAEHEKPVVRVYSAVGDLENADKAAEAAGAVIAYPRTWRGGTGTWAIFFATASSMACGRGERPHGRMRNGTTDAGELHGACKSGVAFRILKSIEKEIADRKTG